MSLFGLVPVGVRGDSGPTLHFVISCGDVLITTQELNGTSQQLEELIWNFMDSSNMVQLSPRTGRLEMYLHPSCPIVLLWGPQNRPNHPCFQRSSVQDQTVLSLNGATSCMCTNLLVHVRSSFIFLHFICTTCITFSPEDTTDEENQSCSGYFSVSSQHSPFWRHNQRVLEFPQLILWPWVNADAESPVNLSFKNDFWFVPQAFSHRKTEAPKTTPTFGERATNLTAQMCESYLNRPSVKWA